MRFLLEADDKPKIDIGVYANEVARLINNYTSLVDIKKNVISQAEQYLDDEFSDESEELKRKLRNLLRVEYHISLERPEPPGESYAVGAGGGGAGGGA
jgi:ribosomal protein RSM22 (predicted rRNA methylase)